MSYRDTLVTCKSCGEQFIFTVEKQRQMAESGLDVAVPDSCPSCLQQVTYGGRLHGRIKWFSLDKGYGFIVQDDGGEVFMHRNGILPSPSGALPVLDEGQEVVYLLEDTPRGPQAVEVAPYS